MNSAFIEEIMLNYKVSYGDVSLVRIVKKPLEFSRKQCLNISSYKTVNKCLNTRWDHMKLPV